VERVLEILTTLRGQMTSQIDRDNMGFIVECIVSDQLYTIQLATASLKASSGGVSLEMEGFLGRHGSPRKGETGPEADASRAPHRTLQNM
jgi:hypothetical protein